MKLLISEAIQYYNLKNCKTELIRHNENMTYKVMDENGQYVLRIHKPIEGFNLGFLRMDFNSVNLIKDEMRLLKHLTINSDLATQRVVDNIYGDSVTVLEDGTPVTMLKWIDGCTLEKVHITEEICFELGVMIAKLHSAVKGLNLHNRYPYGEKLLTRMLEEADIAFSQGHLNSTQTEIIKNTLKCICDYLSELKQRVLVHADLGKSNLIYQNGKIIPIDFSLSGVCVPEMDLASAFSHFNDETLNDCILSGYTSMGNLVDSKGIDVCICFQILLFVLCQHNKAAGEPWFPGKIDSWCADRFAPLISGKTPAKEIGLYV